MGRKRIIFVCNADSGILDAAEDYIHKIISPSTYNCNLCGLTYGNMGMKNEWRQFVSGLGYPVDFLHKDEFAEQFDDENASFPCAYMEYDGDIDLLISSDEMNSLGSLEQLMSLVSEKLVHASERM